MFIRAAELKPGFADPLFNLANIRDYPTANQPELDRIFELLNTPTSAPRRRNICSSAWAKFTTTAGDTRRPLNISDAQTICGVARWPMIRP